MTIGDQIRDEKLQYDINGEAADNTSFIIDKYEYLLSEETLPSNQQQIIEQAKFTYSLLDKDFEKQTETIKDQGEKQIKAIQDNKKQQPNINEDYKNKYYFHRKKKVLKTFIMKDLIK